MNDFDIVLLTRLIDIEQEESIIEELRSNNKHARNALDPWGNSNAACKWETHEEDMLAFSMKHPEVLFILTVTNTETGQSFNKRYEDGTTIFYNN